MILLFGSGIVLGTLAGETGLAERVGTSLADGLGVSSLFAITLLATIVAIVVSETTSNTASVGIVVPIVIPIAAAAGVAPLVPALAATVGAGLRLHAAGLDPAERDRLRVRHGPDHADDALRRAVRHRRAAS